MYGVGASSNAGVDMACVCLKAPSALTAAAAAAAADTAAAVQAVNQQGVDIARERLEGYCELTAAELLGDSAGYKRSLVQLVALLARDKDVVSWLDTRRGGGSLHRLRLSNVTEGLTSLL